MFKKEGKIFDNYFPIPFLGIFYPISPVIGAKTLFLDCTGFPLLHNWYIYCVKDSGIYRLQMTSFPHFLDNIILLGTIQGLITAMLLFRSKTNKTANVLLAWILLFISLACLNIYLLNTITNTTLLWNILEAVVPLVVVMPIGPLVYFYVRRILDPSFKIGRSNRVHFYSTVLDIVPNLVAVTYIIGVFFGLINPQSSDVWGNFIETYNTYIDIPRWLSLTVYLWLTFNVISHHIETERNKVFVQWAKRFSIGFGVFSFLWLLHLIPYSIPSLSNEWLGAVAWYPIYIPLIILVYWLGINGYIISLKTHKKTSKTGGISNGTLKNTILTLEHLMKKEQLYLNPVLKLNDIVLRTKIPQKTVSAALNQSLDKSFNEYINTYRVEAFKSRLLEDYSEKLTITGIAFECGFNSQATFQRAFKAHTNQTPREFRKKHLKNGTSSTQI